MSTPMRGTRSPCCAHAANGIATAALPSPAMNSRRRMVVPQKLHDKAAYRGSGCVGTGRRRRSAPVLLSLIVPTRKYAAAQQVVGYLGYTGRAPNPVAKAAHDP